MERLTVMYEGMMTPRRSCTFDREGCPDDCIPCGDICEASECNDCILQECLTRLGAYEDTGLTPGEITEMKERYTPKKPDYEGDGCDKDGYIIFDTWICPTCGTEYEVDYDEYSYCPECGQKIDWRRGD